ncbi:hypothetical protein DLAC_02207 [Tieghemostelium lacteum]|uniref:Carrier domain-containing protein n=1 Tax=Tieghemostelium lacteum TaxID=361077 RepID=A0A152A4D8_TIELA|nr:hypothetical protein DLAC_02207 [Tieghemostelium lacteum]|eukprot:KYR01106.1 hypothetical protein DLAC_02207 [Tieghemostelium lacteum]
MECMFYHIPQTPERPYKIINLPIDYKPIQHTCTAIALPHYYTREKALQKDLGYLRGSSSFRTMKNAFKYFEDRLCLGVRSPVKVSEFTPSGFSKYRWYTFKEIHVMSNYISNALSYFVSPQESISIYSNNCLEWYIVDFASLWNRYVMVPIHSSSNSMSLLEIFQNSESKAILCQSKNLGNIVQLYIDNPHLEPLRLIIQREDDVDDQLVRQLPKSTKFLTYSQLMQFGMNNPATFPQGPRQPNDIAQINYTSGSTGVPKGVLFNDDIFLKQITPFCSHHYPFALHNLVPLSHADRIITWSFLSVGSRVGIFSGVNETIFEDAALIQPHIFYNVPRLFNLLFSQYKDGLEAIRRNNPLFSLEEADNMIIPKFKKIYGERVKIVGTASAPISQDVLAFIKKCFGSDVHFLYAYGQTEAFFVSFNGRLLDGIKYRLDPVPELDYFPSDKPYPRGELHIQSPWMSQGYNKNTTDISFENGWLKTGDIVEVIAENTINIIGRRKMAFKLSNGKFVSPHLLENAFVTSKLIDQIFIYGDSLKEFLVAIVIPNQATIKKYKESHSDIKSCQVLKKSIMSDFKEIAKKRVLANYEIPNEIELDDTIWSPSNGLVLSSGKVSRANIYQFYKTRIQQIYERLEKLEQSLRDPLSLDQFIRKLLNISENDSIDFDKVSFSQIGGDSFSAVRLCSLLKDNHDIEISPTLLLNKHVMISSIIKLIEQNGMSSNVESLLKVDWRSEMKIPQDIISGVQSLGFKLVHCEDKLQNNVFLTGCTGFLGSFLLYELLKNNRQFGKIYCLTRQNTQSKQQSREYIINVLKKNKMNLGGMDTNRIVPVHGNLGSPNLGLSHVDQVILNSDVDIILHNGAIVNMVLPYHNLKDVNVESTKEIIRMALSGSKLKKLAYVSTLGIFMENGEFRHHEISEGTVPTTDILNVNSGYSSTKFISDSLVRSVSKELGIPTMIFRPGTIFAQSESGFDNQNDFVGLNIKSILNSKSYPQLSDDTINDNSTNYFNLSPVDWVANSIVSLVSHHEYWQLDQTIGKIESKIFNMSNNYSIHLNELCQYIDSVYPLTPVTLDQWKHQQFTSPTSPIYPMKQMFYKSLDYMAVDGAEYKSSFPGFYKHQFSSKITKNYLEKINRKECEPISQDTLTNNIRYLLSLLDINK